MILGLAVEPSHASPRCVIVLHMWCVPALPAGTVQPRPCGSANVFCPSGSWAPQALSIGFYSTGGPSHDQQSAQAECEAGRYCPASGIRSDCPAGRYVSHTRSISLGDCLQCPASSFCGEASCVVCVRGAGGGGRVGG
jgi:hypothetical protein